MWMSGAVGSRPNLMRRACPVCSERCNFFCQSASGINSSQPRRVMASASRTASLMGVVEEEASIEGFIDELYFWVIWGGDFSCPLMCV